MSTKIEVKPETELELVLARIIDAPPDKVYRAWTDPTLIPRWFAPKPWTVAKAETDVRAGGASLVVMKSPDGMEMPCPGVYLEVIPNRKLVFTDAFTHAWQPSGKAFLLATLTFEEHNGKTKYVARVRHWTKEDHDAHVKMGFHEGWGQCADQLEELVRSL